MCHMIAETDEELHVMAEHIGMPRRAYQGDHYDVPLERRALAVAAGAVEVTQRQLVALLWLKLHDLPMLEPATAVARMIARRSEMRGRGSLRSRHARISEGV